MRVLKFCCVRSRQPTVTIRGYSRFKIEVVAKREAQSKLVMVGTGVRQKCVTRIAIDGDTLSGHRNIAQHLIVRRGLLIHKNDVFDLTAGNTCSRRNWVVRVGRYGGPDEAIVA